jgi:tetratricopeptide (TPR) repeat protein
MGKSRLARTVLEWAKRDGAVALEIDCTPSTGNSPLLPLGVLFRRTARIGASMSESDKVNAASQLLADLLGAEKAQETLAYLAPLFGIESVPIPIDKTREQLRAATIGAIVDIVRARAQRGPLALLCEDLHWADDTTAQVVQTVGALVDEIALLFIVTRWPKPVAQVDLEGITAQFTTAPINPLADATAARLVRAVAGEGFPADRVDEIVNRCGGVPLLLEEVTRSTLELANAGEAARTSHTSDSTVPPELQLVVESRLAQWPDLRGVIQAASVLGREFPVPALAAMVPEQADALPEALAQFTEHGLFEPHARPAERATFRHALIRDAVYETLVSRKDLHRLHSRAADALAKGYAGTPDASPEVLARHLREAHRLDEAIRIRLTGAESTFERGAYVEAMGHCQAVGLLLDEVGDQLSVRDDTIRWCVLRGMVESGVHGFSTESALLAYRDAERLLNDATGPELRYPVLRGLALAVLVRGELATAYRYSIDGYEQATRSTRIEHRIDAMSVLAYTTLYVDRLAECRTWIERCLELYDAEHGERFRYPVPQDAKTAALALLPTAAWLLGDAAGAEVAIQRGLQHVDSLGREFDKALLHAWAAGTRYTQRRYLEAIQHAGIAYTVSEAHKFQEWKGIGAMMALISQCALAPAPDAVQQAIMTAERFRALGIGLNRAYFLWGIARGHAVAGNRAAALATLDDALAAAKASEETRMHPEIWLLQAELADDAERRRQLRLDAYRLAQRHGAVANALRAAVAMLADGESRPDAEWAGATLALLDGQAPAPAEAWMPERLKRAEALLGEHRAPA